MAGWKKIALDGDYSEPGHAHTESDVSDLPLNKYDATEAPDADNDVDEGYTPGSRWVDVTNDKSYVCLDNTDGAAVWTEVTQAGGGGGTKIEDADSDTKVDTEEGADEDKVRVDTGGTERLVIDSVGAAFTDVVSVKGTAPDANVWLKANPTGLTLSAITYISAFSASVTSGGSNIGLTGVFGVAVMTGADAATNQSLSGLDFRCKCNLISAITTTFSSLYGAKVDAAAATYLGTINITNARGLWVTGNYSRVISGTVAVGTHTCIDVADVSVGAGCSMTTLQGLKIADCTGATNNRILELGPTPYLRLLGSGSWSPAANETPLYLAEGGTPTLRQVRWKAGDALGSGDKVLVLV